MTTQDIIQTNYSAGQLSPSYLGRREQPRYYNGAKLIQNFIPLPSGGVTRRPPLKHVDDLGGLPAAVIPWQSSPSKSYVLQISVDVSEITVNIYKRSSGATTEVHDFSSSLSDENDGWGDVSYTQSRDTMYFALNGGTKLKKLVNGTGGDTDWTLSDLDLIDGPYQEINLDAELKFDPAAQGGTTTIAAVDKPTAAAVYHFTSDDINRVIRIRHAFDPDGTTNTVHWGYALITGLTAGTEDGATGNFHTVDVTVLDNFQFGSTGGTKTSNPAGTKDWRKGVYSDGDGYPTYAHLFENRMFLARGNQISGSMASNIERHSPTVADESGNHSQTPDSGIDFKLLDFRAEDISWLHSDQVLHIGTNDGRYIMTAKDGVISPTTIGVTKQSGVGCAAIRPVTIDDTLYIRFDKEAVLATDFNFRRDRYEDKNLNIYSDTILTSKVKRIAHSSYPFNIVWCVLENGMMASLTYDKEQEIIAWAIHSVEDETFEDIVSLKAEDEKEVLYVITRNRALESLPLSPVYESLQEIDLTEWEYLQTTTSAETKLVDNFIELSGGTASFTGEQHMAGKTGLVAISNGVNYPQTGTVNGTGDFTLSDVPAGDFHIGLPINTRLETFPIELPSANTTQVGKKKVLTQIDAILHRAGSMSVQMVGSNNIEPVRFRHPDDPVAATPPLFSGQKTIPVSNITQKEVSLIITQEEEAPLTLLGINYKAEVEN